MRAGWRIARSALQAVGIMSVLPLRADIPSSPDDVGFGPEADLVSFVGRWRPMDRWRRWLSRPTDQFLKDR